MNFPPSPAGGIRSVFGTRGIPDLRVGRDGDLATDPTTGKLYAKSAAGWAFKRQGFQRLFIPSSSDDYQCTNGDPELAAGFPYALSASQVGASVLLSWYLTGSSSWPISAAETLAEQVTFYIQRSSSKVNNPLAPAFNNFNVGHGTLAPEAGWTTIKQYNPGDVLPGSMTEIELGDIGFPGLNDAWVGSYQDDTPYPSGEHIANYRLVRFNFADPPGFWQQIDWNIATVKKPYALTASSQVDGVHLSWV